MATPPRSSSATCVARRRASARGPRRPRDERLGELADVAREPARDDRRVLPRQDEDARAHCGPRDPIGSPRDFCDGRVRCAICAAPPAALSHATTAPSSPSPALVVDRLRRRRSCVVARRRGRRRRRDASRRAERRERRCSSAAAGPTAARVVTLTRWRYRADPRRPRPATRGWADGDWRGRDGARAALAQRARRTAAPPAGARTPAASAGTRARSTRRSPAATRCASSPPTTARTVYVDGAPRAQPHRRLRAVHARAPLLRAGRHTVAVRVDWRDPRAPGRRGLAARVVQLRRPAPAGDAHAPRAAASSAR